MAVRIAPCVEDLVSSSHHLRCNDKINKRTAGAAAAAVRLVAAVSAARVATTADNRIFIAVHSSARNSIIPKRLQFTSFVVRFLTSIEE